MKTEDDESYGPVDRAELNAWVAEGRLNRDCQLLREGDEQWQWADSVYPELAEEDVASADESDTAESTDEPRDTDEDEPAPPATAPNGKKSNSKAVSATSSESPSAAKSAGKKTVAKQERGSSTSATATKRSARSIDEEWSDDEQLSDRSRITAGLLGIFLGPLGLHRIYLGYVLIGLLMLATGGGCGIWSLIDAIRVLLGHVPDASGKTLRV